MCTGEGDFFTEFVGDVNALALDRDDMIEIYGGPAVLAGPPDEYCEENPDSYECSEEYKPSDIFTEGEYVAPTYCEETPEAPECSADFGQQDGYQGPLTGNVLAQYAAPDRDAFAGDKPQFCTDKPDHPECFRDYYGAVSYTHLTLPTIITV